MSNAVVKEIEALAARLSKSNNTDERLLAGILYTALGANALGTLTNLARLVAHYNDAALASMDN